MAQRQFRSDDTDKWKYGFGGGGAGDGSINTSTDAPIDSACSGTAGQTSLSATNASFAAGQLILIHQTRGTGVGNWELNKIASYSAGTITTAHALCNTYTNSGASVAQVLVMTQYNNLTINSGQTLTAKAWNGTVGGIIAYFVKGTFQGQSTGGTITLSAKGFRGGSGGQNKAGGYTGEGTVGAQVFNQRTANGSGGGAGTYDDNPAGGGSNGSAGGDGIGSGNPGPGYGATATNSSVALTTVWLGGGAGGGGEWDNVAAGDGGSGGGFCLIIAKDINLTYLTMNSIGGTGTNGSGNNAPGGGGAGGSFLIKAQTAVLGTNKIVATGGAGGVNGRIGGAGGNGMIHLDYKTSTSGTTNPTLDATQDATLDWVSGVKFFQFL